MMFAKIRTGPRPIAHKRRGECSWPCDIADRPHLPENIDTSDRLFCCEPCEPGSSYCPSHTWDSISPARRRGPRP